jgi:hypothetical protein
MTEDGTYAVALGAVLLSAAIARSAWKDWRACVGISLVILGGLLDYGVTGKAYPGGPEIAMETQTQMFLAGLAAVLAGYVLLAWSIFRPRAGRRRTHPAV